MNIDKATKLATLLGGTVDLMPQSRTPGPRVTLPNGRVVLIEEFGGMAWKSAADELEYDADGLADDHVAENEDWGEWDCTEKWATGLATLLGAYAHQSGGNIWVVLYTHPDGRFTVIGLDGADLYPSRYSYEAGDDASCEGVTWIEWENDAIG